MMDNQLNNQVTPISQQIKLSNQAFNLVKEMVLRIQPNGQFCMVNNAVVNKLGYTHQQLINRSIWDISAEFSVANWTYHWQEIKTAKMTRFESIWLCKDGSPLAVDLSLHFVELEGQAYINAIAHNIGKKWLGKT